MRSYIFTEWEREKLKEWLTEDFEDQMTRDLFSKIRSNTQTLSSDLQLMLLVIKKLRIEGRWRGRIRPKSEFGSALLGARSALARLRKRTLK